MPIRTGVDVTSISRVEELLDKYGEHFKQRFFSLPEVDYAESRADTGASYAGLWAAKEAVFKTLGKGKRWNDVIIHHEASGRPRVEVTERLINEPYVPIPPEADWDCSITHDGGIAVATAACVWGV